MKIKVIKKIIFIIIIIILIIRKKIPMWISMIMINWIEKNKLFKNINKTFYKKHNNKLLQMNQVYKFI